MSAITVLHFRGLRYFAKNFSIAGFPCAHRCTEPSDCRTFHGWASTVETILKFPDKFTYVNAMGSDWWADSAGNYEKYDLLVKAAAPELKKTLKYFIFTTGGATDIADKNNDLTKAVFDKYGVNPAYRKWKVAIRCMSGAMTFVISPRKFSGKHLSSSKYKDAQHISFNVHLVSTHHPSARL